MSSAPNDPDTDNWTKLKICEQVQALMPLLTALPAAPTEVRS